jgi:DNA-binding HxlR family transcriptional regulator
MLDKDVVNSLLSEVPSEVFDAITPLSNKNSQVIFIALLKNEQMRFGDIKQLFHIKNSEEINHPLKSLVKAGLVSKKAEYLEEIGDSEIAVYCPTVMGKSMMRSLYKGVMVGSEKISYPQSQNKAINLSGGIVGHTPYEKMYIHEKNYSFNPNKIEYQQIPVAIGGR